MTIQPYESRFGNWDLRSSVRTKPRRLLDAAENTVLFFPPELVPAVGHVLVAEREPEFAQRVLLHSLYQYLHFTTVLEQVAVLPVTASISLGRSGVDLPKQMRADAFKITTDEAWHAQCSHEFSGEIERVTGISPSALVDPRFVTLRDQVRETFEPNSRHLVDLLFAVVSETLVSRLLSDIPNDKRLPQPVRAIIADHAADEGHHHVYFRNFLRFLWPQMSQAERRAVGLRIPDFIRVFLYPDLGAVSRSLAESGFVPQEVNRIMEETYVPSSPVFEMATVAKATVTSFREVGALDDDAVASAFAAAGMFKGGEPYGRIGPEPAAGE